MATVVVLTTADTSPWTVPSDWNNTNNNVQAIGGGGAGAAGSATTGGTGGGAGAYAKVSNLTLSGTVAFTIGVAGVDGVSSPGNTQFKDSFFSSSFFTSASILGILSSLVYPAMST